MILRRDNRNKDPLKGTVRSNGGRTETRVESLWTVGMTDEDLSAESESGAGGGGAGRVAGGQPARRAVRVLPIRMDRVSVGSPVAGGLPNQRRRSGAPGPPASRRDVRPDRMAPGVCHRRAGRMDTGQMIQVRFNGVHTLWLWSQDWETDSYCFDKRPYFCVIPAKEA